MNRTESPAAKKKRLESIDWDELAHDVELIINEEEWHALFEQLKEAISWLKTYEYNVTGRKSTPRLRATISPLYKALAASPFVDISSMYFEQPEVAAGLSINPMVPLWLEADENFCFHFWMVMDYYGRKSINALGHELRLDKASLGDSKVKLQDFFRKEPFFLTDTVLNRDFPEMMTRIEGASMMRLTSEESSIPVRCTKVHCMIRDVYRLFEKTPPPSPMAFVDNEDRVTNPVDAENYADELSAQDIETPADELVELASVFPLQVAANPNANEDAMMEAILQAEMVHAGAKPWNAYRTGAVLVLEALASNPALELIWLKNPSFLSGIKAGEDGLFETISPVVLSVVRDNSASFSRHHRDMASSVPLNARLSEKIRTASFSKLGVQSLPDFRRWLRRYIQAEHYRALPDSDAPVATFWVAFDRIVRAWSQDPSLAQPFEPLSPGMRKIAWHFARNDFFDDLHRAPNPTPGDYEGLVMYLGPKDKVYGIGPEKGPKAPQNGLVRWVSPHGSSRYVAFVAGQPVAVLQVVSRDGKEALAANAYCRPEFRRQGWLGRLAARARQDFLTLRMPRDESMSPLGHAFATSKLDPPS